MYCQILCTENLKLKVEFEQVILNMFLSKFYKHLKSLFFYSFLKFSVKFLELFSQLFMQFKKFSHNF